MPQFLVARDTNGLTRRVAWHFEHPAQTGGPVLVWFPGFKSDMVSLKATALAEFAAGQGFGCLRFDYSGHGQSEGAFEDGTVSRWLADAEAALAQVPDESPLVYVGSSMGGWIALLLSRTRRPKGLVLIAPAWDMTRVMWERATPEARETLLRDGVYWRPSQYDPEPYAITRALIEDGKNHLFAGAPVPVDAPVRIMHGMLDPDVPWQHSIDLLNLLAGQDARLTLIKDGEHRLSRPQDIALLFSLVSEMAA